MAVTANDRYNIPDLAVREVTGATERGVRVLVDAGPQGTHAAVIEAPIDDVSGTIGRRTAGTFLAGRLTIAHPDRGRGPLGLAGYSGYAISNRYATRASATTPDKLHLTAEIGPALIEVVLRWLDDDSAVPLAAALAKLQAADTKASIKASKAREEFLASPPKDPGAVIPDQVPVEIEIWFGADTWLYHRRSGLIVSPSAVSPSSAN